MFIMSQHHISTKRAPIYRDSAFIFENIDDSEQTFQAEINDPQSGAYFIYTRYGNPTVIETECALAKLEGSAWAALTASGMAAIDVALSVFQKQGETGTWLFFSEIYGGTKTYVTQILEQRRGVPVAWFAPEPGQERYDLAKLEETLDRVRPQVLYFEPIANPLLIVVDGDAIVKAAKARGITVIVDNTFATPALWRPLASGADLVIQSATKYFSGHGNLTAGLICGNDPELRKAIMAYRKFIGNVLSPDDAYRLHTQALTFDLRFARQCANAAQFAQMLAAHPQVARVRYPGLPTHATHQEAARLFGGQGFGAMVTAELKGGRAACDQFMAAARPHIEYLTTLGDPQTSLIHVPTVFTAERFPFPGMLRFSVGFEPYAELSAAVQDAFAALSA